MRCVNVAGPYVFGIGLIGFLFSKEIWLFEHQFTHFCAFWLAFYVLVRKFGAPLRKYVQTYREASYGLRA